MKRRPSATFSALGLHAERLHSDPFCFLPLVVEALNHADVSCRLCGVKMVSRAGLIGDLCPSCFEERCAKCGDEVLLAGGALARGLKVGRAGSWKCAKCAGPRAKRCATKRCR